MAKVRWGVLGVAKIGVTKVIPAMQRGDSTDVVAIASRDLVRATEAAQALGIEAAYGSYEALLADPGVEAIYIPLPNHLHVPWTTRAAEAGKHVLCEKPIALSVAEARSLVDVRNRTGVLIQEAFMVRTHPQWIKAVALVRDGTIGELRSMVGAFSYFNDDAGNIRNVRAFGGGALMDIGCYLINTGRLMFGREPLRVAGAIDRDPALGIDRLTSMILDFGGGHLAGTCSTQAVPYQRMQIFGTRGRIEIEIPFNAPPDRPCRLVVDKTGDLFGAGLEPIDMPICDQYTIQADLFSRAIRRGDPAPIPIEDAVANMACIEAVARSAESGRWEYPICRCDYSRLALMRTAARSDVDSQPDLSATGSSLTASITACFASSRVESRIGSGEFSVVMISGISVQPRITHSAPRNARSAIAAMNRFVVAGVNTPRTSSSKIVAFSSSRTGSSGIRSRHPSLRQRLRIHRPGHRPARAEQTDVFPATALDLVTNDVGDVQSRQRQVRGDFFEDDVGRVVGTDVEVSAGVSDLLHAARQVPRDHGAVAGDPTRHAQPHRNRAQDDAGVHVRAEMRGSFTAGGDEAERATFSAVRDDSKCLHGKDILVHRPPGWRVHWSVGRPSQLPVSSPQGLLVVFREPPFAAAFSGAADFT